MSDVNGPTSSAVTPAPLRHSFHDTDADMVLRSADGVLFSVHRIILSKASSVFNDVFSLARPQPSEAETIPTIDVSEDAQITNLFLTYCYPTNDPVIDDLNITCRLLETMSKYQTDGLTQRVAKVLESFMTGEPLRVFAIACHFGLKPTARKAARLTLKLSIWPLAAETVPEFQLITAATFQNLLQYHRACAAKAVDAIDDLKWIHDSSWVWFQCKRCTPYGSHCRIKQGSLTYVPRDWWMEYLAATREHLELRPLGSVVPRPAFLKSDEMEEARKCASCGTSGIADVLRFSEVLQEHLEVVMDEVSTKHVALGVCYPELSRQVQLKL